MRRLLCFLCVCWSASTLALSPELYAKLCILKKVYPAFIRDFDEEKVVWHNGTIMPLWDNDSDKSTSEILETPSFVDQLLQEAYVSGELINPPQTDSGRIRYEPFFRTMYGNSPREVYANLSPVKWMPAIFGNDTRTVRVSRVNDVHIKIQAISDELEVLARNNPELIPFLKNIGGTFNWRTIANTNRLSAHSFGITIDINPDFSHYWQWDLKDAQREISETAELSYRNLIPWCIVHVFEKHGFIWGGKWRHYDTMHFEYRPELFQSEDSQATHMGNIPSA
jgi:peptidoglycan LD-endopeptidase CwlK